MKKVKLLFLLFFVFALGIANAQVYNVDTKSSVLEWTGKKVVGEHNGVIKLKSGEFKFEGNKIASGKFVVDMGTIVNLDLENEEFNQKLVGHLKSDDFFGTDKYPTATFEITNSSELSNNSYKVKGNLTIKGITHPIEFIVNKAESGEGIQIKGTVAVDRTKYNIKYGSGKFFDKLGDNMIDDEFTINLNVLAS